MVILCGILFIHWKADTELRSIRHEEKKLALSPPHQRQETSIGCRPWDKYQLDIEGCAIGVVDIYQESGADRKLEKLFNSKLLANGWRRRHDNIYWISPAIHLSDNPSWQYLKNTNRGRYCAGITYRFLAQDRLNGPRLTGIYILGSSDRMCAKWGE